MTPGTYTVATVNLTGSTYNLNKASAASNWTQCSGTLAGSGNVTVASGKTYAWTGGSMGGTGTTTVASGGTLTINAGEVGISRTLTNNGTVTWVAGQLQITNGTIDNNATFTAQPDNSVGQLRRDQRLQQQRRRHLHPQHRHGHPRHGHPLHQRRHD